MVMRRGWGVGPACVAALLVLATVASVLPTSQAVSIDTTKPNFVAGEVGDATCNVEDVQSANEHQLHEILAELTNTTYFRLFQVDLNRPCKFWNKPVSGEEQEDEQTCSAAPAEVSASSLDGLSGNDLGSSSQEPPTMCSLDLASKDTTQNDLKWTPPTTPVDTTISTFEHKSLDGVDGDDGSCAEDRPEFWLDMCESGGHGKSVDNSVEHVNLQLNPERWTGYNGSHVWSSIYHENCLRGVEHVNDMCYEERVLYRLLSGMHASVNVHIALKAKPPKKGVVGRETWSPDPQRFQEMYGEHPDRLRNLHFSFVVMLRALRKASGALFEADVKLGQDAVEDQRTQALLRRLLDTHILTSCQGVFGAFDESLLFKAVAEEIGINGGDAGNPAGTGLVEQPSLKSQFKGVFHNISDVMDCISCQKCKLHGKLQLLGLGTALKVLLLPEHMHATALSRAEIVALINTVAKFSHAILKAPELAAAAEALPVGTGKTPVKTTKTPVKSKDKASGQSAKTKTKGVSAKTKGTPKRELLAAYPETPSLVDKAVGAIATLADAGALSAKQETALLDAIFDENQRVLTLAKHYDGEKFVERALRIVDVGDGEDAGEELTPTPTEDAAAVENAAAERSTAEKASAEQAAAERAAAEKATAERAAADERAAAEKAAADKAAAEHAAADKAAAAAAAAAKAAEPTPEPTPQPTPEPTPTPTPAPTATPSVPTTVEESADAIVVGGGLAGLTAALTLLDRGAKVILLEKEGFAGGNSQWASSGINGVDANFPEGNPDSVSKFTEDCEKSSLGRGEGAATDATLDGFDKKGAGSSDSPPSPESVEHISTLTLGSVETLQWFKRRVGVDLSLVGQLGGHQHARTHRPAAGMAGSVLVTATQKACDAYAQSGMFILRKRARAEEIIMGNDGAVRGVRWSPVARKKKGDGEGETDTTKNFALSKSVILATGGFANDKLGADSLLRRYAPSALDFATTNTRGTTGDGHKMALRLGAAAVDLNNVQIHPTGFVDPKDPGSETKTLCAEILRGAGAVLLTRDGRRFADELGTRDYLSGRMLAEALVEENEGGVKKGEGASLEFAIVLNAAGAEEAEKHVSLYTQKGLLKKVEGVARVASWLKRELHGDKVVNEHARKHRGGRTVEAALRSTLNAYDSSAVDKVCQLTNKTHFNNAPFLDGVEKPGSPPPVFYVGRVTPVTHYTMGGVRVDVDGRVVRNAARAARTGQKTVQGLYAAGELIGGVHGKNRLGGNALTECAVFGRRVGMAVPLEEGGGVEEASVGEVTVEEIPEEIPEEVPEETEEEVEEADEEEADEESELVEEEMEESEMDGEEMEEEMDEEEMEEDETDKDSDSANASATVTRAELALHSTETDCWVALYGEVYDFTDFLEDHPAGTEAITKFAGMDGTAGFDAVHSPGMLDEFEAVGSLVD